MVSMSPLRVSNSPDELVGGDLLADHVVREHRAPASSCPASRALRSFFGIASKAGSAGAKTVSSGAELSGSTRSAAVTAATRVLSSGLALAAEATGAVAMPSNEPSPSVGTSAQPAP